MYILCLNVGSQVLSYGGRVGSCHCHLLDRGGRIYLFSLISSSVYHFIIIIAVYSFVNLVKANDKLKQFLTKKEEQKFIIFWEGSSLPFLSWSANSFVAWFCL